MEYGFIEVEYEPDQILTKKQRDDLIYIHDSVKLAVNDKEGLNTIDWAQARNKMLETGEFDPNLELSKAQRFWVNETKNALRAIKNNDAEKHLSDIE